MTLLVYVPKWLNERKHYERLANSYMLIASKYMKKILLISLAVVVGVLVIGTAGFVIWASNTNPIQPEAIAALESDELVQVEQEPWLIFTPTDSEPTTGFIFYPGGKVDHRAYSPSARAIAEQGYLVVVPSMPLNLAFFDANEASNIIAAYPSIQQWAIGGHSLGGTAAAMFSDRNRDLIDGIAFWASYPAGSNDLSNADFAITSIYGTNDGVATPADIDASRPLLPPDTIWVSIEGGNHAQFGWYGDQDGDNPATISQEEQQAQIVEATVALLEKIASE